jgi:hypothetical protein
MTGPWRAALGAAAGLVCAALARAGGGTECELARTDRAHTPSRNCITCHDGTVGEAFGVVFGGTGSAGNGAPVTSHPVGISYADAAARQPGKYTPASALPADLPLVRGKVECTTCHDGTATNPKRVARPNDMCTTCHRI